MCVPDVDVQYKIRTPEIRKEAKQVVHFQSPYESKLCVCSAPEKWLWLNANKYCSALNTENLQILSTQKKMNVRIEPLKLQIHKNCSFSDAIFNGKRNKKQSTTLHTQTHSSNNGT